MTDKTTRDRSDADETRPPSSAIRQIGGGRKALVWLLSLFVRLWCRTLRFKISPADLAAGRFAEQPAVILLWHNCLFVVPFVIRFFRPQRAVKALISASNDGAWLTDFFRHLGITAVRGSSSRLGREALHEIIAQLRSGHDIAITPDGPRGPKYDMKPGALLTARRVRVPILLFGFEFGRAWRTASWDQLYVPWPFSRVTIHCEIIPPEQLPQGHTVLVHLRHRLMTLCGKDSESTSESTPDNSVNLPDRI